MDSRYFVVLLVLSTLLGAESEKYGCGGDPNAAYGGCNNWCGHSCDDYMIPNKPCTLICEIDGCKCREGYVYNQVTKRCVPPEDCHFMKNLGAEALEKLQAAAAAAAATFASSSADPSLQPGEGVTTQQEDKH